MECFILLRLPEVISRQVLTEWLLFMHMVKLDTAVCNYKTREKYLNLAYGRDTTFTMESSRQEQKLNSLLNWAVSRNAQLDGIHLAGKHNCSDGLLERFLTMTGPTVRWIDSCGERGRHGVCSAQRQQLLLEIADACPNIRTLKIQDLDGTVLWDESLIDLTRKLQQLTSLELFGVGHSKQGLASALNNCRCLKALLVGSVHPVLPVEVALPSMEVIVAGSDNMTDAVLLAMGERCAKLEKLVMFTTMSSINIHSVTDAGVRAVLQGCPLLCKTDAEYAGGISIELRVELARRSNFTTMTLRQWYNMSPPLAQGLLSVSPNLTELNLSGCSWLTDATLARCAQHCPPLETFVMRGCGTVNHVGVRALVSKVGSTLRTIDLDGCSRLGDETIQAIAEHCPLLRQITYPPNVTAAADAFLNRGCPLLLCRKMSTIQ
jgi:hypothetical protein